MCYIVEFSEVENGIILHENVTYRSQYQRDLQYYVSVEILGNVDYGGGSFNGYVWAVVMKRYKNCNVTLVLIKWWLYVCSNDILENNDRILFLNRKLTRVIAQVFVPTAIMVALSWFSFLIPPNSYPGRVGILVLLLRLLMLS